MEDRKTLCKKEFTNCEIVKENKQLQDKLKKIEEYINNKSEINFECGKWVNTLEIEKIIKGDD